MMIMMMMMIMLMTMIVAVGGNITWVYSEGLQRARRLAADVDVGVLQQRHKHLRTHGDDAAAVAAAAAAAAAADQGDGMQAAAQRCNSNTCTTTHALQHMHCNTCTATHAQQHTCMQHILRATHLYATARRNLHLIARMHTPTPQHHTSRVTHTLPPPSHAQVLQRTASVELAVHARGGQQADEGGDDAGLRCRGK